MSILKAFIKAFEKKEERGWDKIYVFVDVHETVLYPTYELNGEKRFYPHALDTLREMSQRVDISLGLYTCSYPHEIKDYLRFFTENGIVFEHVNTNKEEKIVNTDTSMTNHTIMYCSKIKQVSIPKKSGDILHFIL